MRTTAGEGTWLRAGLLVALLLAGVVVALVVDLPGRAQVRAWVDSGGAGTWTLLIAGQAAVLLAPVPRSVVAALAGAVLGFGAGLAVTFTGSFLAALVAFGLARLLGRPAAERLAGPRVRTADRLFSDRGFVAVVTGRLIPFMPFVVVNYAAGLSGVRPRTYVAATAVGLVPGTVVQVAVGASAGAVAAWVTTLSLLPVVAVVVLLVLGVAASWYRWRTAARARERV